ncbi:unnamed protein product, partial [Chrysoparadoxa australica]
EYLPVDAHGISKDEEEEDQDHETGTEAEDAGLAGAAGGGKSSKLPMTFCEVLKQYVEDPSEGGLAVIDQPGAGITSQLLHFMHWYGAGYNNAGCPSVASENETNEIPGYGRCQLAKVLLWRRRWVLRRTALLRTSVSAKRRALLLYIDASDPAQQWTKESVVHYIISQLIDAFELPIPTPSRAALREEMTLAQLHEKEVDSIGTDLAQDSTDISHAPSNQLGPELFMQYLEVAQQVGDLILVLDGADSLKDAEHHPH